jgi:hypothetical protein
MSQTLDDIINKHSRPQITVKDPGAWNGLTVEERQKFIDDLMKAYNECTSVLKNEAIITLGST